LDVDALDRYWSVCPTLRQTLFKEHRHGYLVPERKPGFFKNSVTLSGISSAFLR
jgi:hypothetical protein